MLRLDQLDIFAFGSLKPVDGLALKTYTHDDLLSWQKAKSGTYSNATEIFREDLRVLRTASWHIRGNSYRPQQAQSALRNKNAGNRVLMIREPANSHDPNALAVLVAQSTTGVGCQSSEYNWVFVGYAPKEMAARAAQHWPVYEGKYLIAEGQLTSAPAHHQEPTFKLTGWRRY